MPGKVKVRVVAGRGLPIMDKSNDTTDAYVEVKLGQVTYKTDVCRKSLNPQWNSEWFKFEMDDLELQDEPLHIRLMDYDTYSANDAIGKVYLDLNPLLINSTKTKDNWGKTISGWLPVYDTMHGLRGEVNLIVKVELFSDLNKYRQSSCGVRFFFSPQVPEGFVAHSINGFVEELVINDDPEYQWIDKIRTPRASNEARQTLFQKLSGEVQRKVGLKTLELGGNAVVGYKQCIDIEGESGLVIRGIGTAMYLTKLSENQLSPVPLIEGASKESPIPEEYVEPTAAASCAIPNNTNSSHNPASSPPKRLGSPQKPIPSSTHSTSGGNGFYGDHHESKSSGQMYNGNSGSGSPEKGGGAAAASTPNTKQSNYGQMHRRSSESDLSTTPNTKGGGGPTFKTQFQRPFVINVDPIRGQEFPFITLSSQFPENFIRYLGGTVTARSVKLLKSIGNFEEPSPETRDGWWNEIRIEMRSHCRAFGCNVLLDYEEKTTMWDEVAILSASGTAAIISTSGNCGDVNMSELGDVNNKDGHKRTDSFTGVVQLNMGARSSPKISRGRYDDSDELEYPCRMLHIPQPSLSLPTIIRKSRCAYCRKGKVPDVLVATIDLPPGLHTTGRSCLIQTQVFRSKKESKGEVGAKEMSDSIPFLEYELHRRLINKLKVQGLNAIFGYKVQITQGDKVVVGVATGTAVFLTALPVPSIPTICAGNLKTDAQKVLQFQKVIQETFERNREIFGVNNIVLPNWGDINGSTSDGESDDELDNSHEAKDTFVLEVDDAEDIDIITMLIDQAIPVGYNMSNIETIVGFDGRKVLSQQMFNQVWRCKIATISQRQLTAYFERLIRLVSFKLRRLQPCVFTRMHFTIDLPESDEMQLTVIGMALGLDAKMHQVSLPSTSGKIGELGKQDDDPDIIFQFDEDKTKLGISCESSAENLASSNQTHHSTPPLSAGLPQKVPHPLSSPTGASGLSGGLQQTKISSGTSPVTASVNIALPLNVSHGHGNSSNVNLPLGETGRNRSHSVFCARHPNSNSKSTRFISFIKPMPLPVSKMRHWVEITPQKSINGAKIERYLGNLNFYFIRETTSLRESGGVNTFVHALFTDFMAIVRAHTSALGGNAIVSYFMTRCDLSDLSKCVINVGGDAVFVSYPVHHPEDGIAIG
ncbi:C2 domain-containing protein 5 isoform X4 [Folsomia candida]|uniref:C2 domain-containing protein 5 isoform X4 n=1 Tax=Folsomia candida TaxID=158441 RepID=UPI001605420C|nr:C2 domain-containing protein 5 isoform X4 [Folsomia candida]